MKMDFLGELGLRLKHFCASVFYQTKHKIVSASLDKINKRLNITLDKKIFTEQYGKPEIVIEGVPYSWAIDSLKITNNFENIELSTLVPNIIQGFPFNENTVYIQGVIIKDENGNRINEAENIINRSYKVYVQKHQNNNTIFLSYPYNKEGYITRDDFKFILFYKSFKNNSNITIDLSEAKLLFYPLEVSSLGRVNRFILPYEYTLSDDFLSLSINLGDYFCIDPFFDNISIGEKSFLYTNPAIVTGDIEYFNKLVSKAAASIQELDDSRLPSEPLAVLCIDYNGFEPSVPINSIDETSVRAEISNVKQQYVLHIGIITHDRQKYGHEQIGDLSNWQQTLTNFKLMVHNKIRQVLDRSLITAALDDLDMTIKENNTFVINFDSDNASWEENEAFPYIYSAITIKTIYNSKDIKRLEDVIITKEYPTNIYLGTKIYNNEN